MSSTDCQATAVRTAVHRFYRLVVADDQLAPYFVGTDVGRLETYLARAVTRALDADERTWPTELISAHQGLGLTEDDFDLLGHLLLTTLLPLRLGPDLLLRVGAGLSDAQARVVERRQVVGPAARVTVRPEGSRP